MIFARYKGAEADGFTAGRTYVAKPEMDDRELVGFGFVEVCNDRGEVVKVDPEQGQFEFVDEVYAVARKPLEDVARGEVVVVEDASEDRLQFVVKGSGFWKVDMLVVLDGTNLSPGTSVCDRGRWVKVSRVDEAMWIVVDGEDAFRSPEEFRFAVSEEEGELMVEPLVTCVMSQGKRLTAGRRYYLVESLSDGGVKLLDDDGALVECLADRFKMG